jgi:hypothetical protein
LRQEAGTEIEAFPSKSQETMQKVFSRKFNSKAYEEVILSVLIVTGLAGFFYFLRNRNRKFTRRSVSVPKIDIEIRYAAERDADATLLAQNQVKIIRMVLQPIEKQILQEKAALIYVFGGDYWEMRLKNASDSLKTAIREILESKEW